MRLILRRAVSLAPILLLCFAVWGCSTSHLDEQPTLINTEWRHLEMNGEMVGSLRLLDFRPTELVGNTECGKFSARYEAEDDALAVEVIFFANNCLGYSPTDVLEFVAALEAADRYVIENDRLYLSRDGATRLVFIAN